MDLQDERHFILIKENICKAKIFHKLNITSQNIYELKKEKNTEKVGSGNDLKVGSGAAKCCSLDTAWLSQA